MFPPTTVIFKWTNDAPAIEVWRCFKYEVCRILQRTSRRVYELKTNQYSSVKQSHVILFHQPTLMHNFLYSLTICLLHYYPRHVSSINMPIFRRKNCIHTASGIFALCKRLHSTLRPLSTSVLCRRLQRAKIPDAVWIQFFLLKMGMLMLETCRG